MATNTEIAGLPVLPHCRQFTIPLLFDNCPSVYQKLCSLWAKLNELIDSYNNLLTDLDDKFSKIDISAIENIQTDIANIKRQLATIANQITVLQTNLDALTQRVTTAEEKLLTLTQRFESEISDINTSLNKFNTDLNNLTTKINSLTDRVTAIEQQLANLNIDIPMELLNDSKWTQCRNAWWNWFNENICNALSLYSNWQLTDKLFYWDTNTPPHSLKIGRVGQNIVLSKMPFIAFLANVGTGATIPASCTQLVQNLALKFSDMSTFAFTAGNGFFNWQSIANFPYLLDECKFRTSYIPFLPSMSQLYEIDTSAHITNAKAIETDVRIQLNQNSSSHKMCIAGNKLYVGICPDMTPVTSSTTWSVYIYQIAENS